MSEHTVSELVRIFTPAPEHWPMMACAILGAVVFCALAGKKS